MNTYHRASNWKNKSVDHFFLNVLMFSLRSVSNPAPTRMCSTYFIAPAITTERKNHKIYYTTYS